MLLLAGRAGVAGIAEIAEMVLSLNFRAQNFQERTRYYHGLDSKLTSRPHSKNTSAELV